MLLLLLLKGKAIITSWGCRRDQTRREGILGRRFGWGAAVVIGTRQEVRRRVERMWRVDIISSGVGLTDERVVGTEQVDESVSWYGSQKACLQ